MNPSLRLCLCCVSQGHAKFYQQVDEDVARMRRFILLVEKFSALLLWSRKGLALPLYGRAQPRMRPKTEV